MKINISIDDVSPHPLSSVKVLDRCFELIKEFPEIKFSLFIPIAYWRTTRPGIATKQPLIIDQFPEFCKTLRELPASNFEICYHGLFHGIPGQSDNDEFQHLTEEQAISKFNNMFSVVNRANLQNVFKPIFRPPAWRMSPGAIKAAEKVGIKILALSPKDYAKATYQGFENSFPKVIYYNCNPPFDPLAEYPVVEIVYHACEWDKNYFSIELAKQLRDWLKLYEDISFEFMESL
jgi:predicted deacetylase